MAGLGVISNGDIAALSEGAKDFLEVLKEKPEQALDDAVTELLSVAQDERAMLEDFRNSLSALTDQFSGHGAESDRKNSFPLIFIVDELDRCRPPFALSVIERIKHMFSVDNICFALVTNFGQLERAVEGQYGSNISAGKYLEKFYQLRVVLPDDGDTREKRSKYVDYLWGHWILIPQRWILVPKVEKWFVY